MVSAVSYHINLQENDVLDILLTGVVLREDENPDTD